MVDYLSSCMQPGTTPAPTPTPTPRITTNLYFDFEAGEETVVVINAGGTFTYSWEGGIQASADGEIRYTPAADASPGTLTIISRQPITGITVNDGGLLMTTAQLPRQLNTLILQSGESTITGTWETLPPGMIYLDAGEEPGFAVTGTTLPANLFYLDISDTEAVLSGSSLPTTLDHFDVENMATVTVTGTYTSLNAISYLNLSYSGVAFTGFNVYNPPELDYLGLADMGLTTNEIGRALTLAQTLTPDVLDIRDNTRLTDPQLDRIPTIEALGVDVIYDNPYTAYLYVPTGAVLTDYTDAGINYRQVELNGISGTVAVTIGAATLLNSAFSGTGATGGRSSTGAVAPGGGGAGQVKEQTNLVLPVGDYALTLPKGPQGPTSGGSNYNGLDGLTANLLNSASAIVLTALGGGGGDAGAGASNGKGNGGGGGSYTDNLPKPGGTAASGGFPGGASNTSSANSNRAGGGGGGAGGAGGNGVDATAPTGAGHGGDGGLGKNLAWMRPARFVNSGGAGSGANGSGTVNPGGASAAFTDSATTGSGTTGARNPGAVTPGFAGDAYWYFRVNAAQVRVLAA